MGRRSLSGGVRAAGLDRVQFTFMFEGIRYRPTLPWTPTAANLRRARQHLIGIKTRILAETFSFAEEFPDYRHIKNVPRCGSPRTCDQVFDEYLAHCSARVVRHDMAPVTLTSYRKVLDGTWRPELGPLRFLDVRYSTLVLIADRAEWCKKSHNNAISVLRRAFEFGYRDHPERHNPTRDLKGARIQQKDRPYIDPFTLDEAEALIAAIRRDWGDAQANYDEFRFFTGLRPSEQIALLVSDYDAARGTLDVTRARVNGIDKDSTKTGDDRRIALCPRAVGVLNRHLALREELARARQHRPRFSVLQGERPATAQPAVSGYALASVTDRPQGCSVSQAVHRAAYFRELGSHDWPQRLVGRAAARSQHRNYAALLRSLGGRRARIRRREDPCDALLGRPPAPPTEDREPRKAVPLDRTTLRNGIPAGPPPVRDAICH